MKDLVSKFDPKLIVITVFFMIFERQAEKANISYSQLLPLLSTEIAEIILDILSNYRCAQYAEIYGKCSNLVL